MTKKCIHCQIEKDISFFNKRKSCKDGLNTICKPCVNNYSKKHYGQNKASYYKKAKDWRKREIAKFIAYIKTQKCKDCGESDPVVLEFDHLYDKKFNISIMIGEISFSTLKKEIEKCDVVCANCHRKRTAKAFNWKKQR